MQKRIPMGERPPAERIKDFKEVNRGYTADEMLAEAKRCLQCKDPQCVKGCPVEIEIPKFIAALAKNDPEKAARILKEKNNLPAVCGRVCPQEHQCELKCVLARAGEPVSIGHLERFAADWQKAHPTCNAVHAPEGPQKAKVAVIGSGPAGLSCAGDLAKMGFAVTVFESLHKSGGVLRYGIPEFRLPSEVLDYELGALKALGVTIVHNSLIGRTKSITDLFEEGFRAIFVGTGAGLPKFLNIPGENLNHIYSANEFLVRVNLMGASRLPDHDTPLYIGRHVAIIGGGNTAMDAARTALRLGAGEVTLVYRRSEEEMPSRLEERRHAREEGVRFLLQTTPIRFIGDDKGFVKEMELVKMELGEPDRTGRRRPRIMAGSNFTVPADMVILAIGLSPNPVLLSLTKGLETDANGRLKIDEHFMTTIPGVFAGGDIVGGDTVIQAMGMGKKAACAIAQYLSKDHNY